MTARELLWEAIAAGVEVVTDGARVGLRGPRRQVERLHPHLAEAKADLLRLLRPDFTAPCPPDVARIREIVRSWPASFAIGWAELVLSAMVAGRDQHDAERLAYAPLAEDAPKWATESGEAPGPWPPEPQTTVSGRKAGR